MLLAYTPKDMLEGIFISLAVGELNPVVRQDGVELVRNGGSEVA
jgi:hypothetical protein